MNIERCERAPEASLCLKGLRNVERGPSGNIEKSLQRELKVEMVNVEP